MDHHQRWQLKKDLFAAAAELSADQRDAFLALRCPDDPALRREIEVLLQQLDLSHPGRSSVAALLPPPPDHPQSLAAGVVLASRFRIERFIGRGGMGEVYEAEDLELSARVALKTLNPGLGADPHFLLRFKREVHLARQITHVNVCRVFDVGFDPRAAFLTMELLTGESLAQLLRRGLLPNARVESFAVQILEALAAAHARRITHRDLKPGNIAVTADGVVKLVDFGLAKLLLQQRNLLTGDTTVAMLPDATRAGIVMGTAGYMSPEQAVGKDVDERSDLFSFGVVLYEMATGRRAFGSGHPNQILARLVTEQPEPASRLNPAISPAVAALIASCLEKDLSKRCPSAVEALAQLRGLPAAAAAPPSRRRWIYASAGTAAAASAAGVLAWKSLSPESLWDSLAILPFVNEGPAENEFLADGFTENLINEVSAGSLRVIARNAVYRFSRKEEPADIARKLGVAAVLTGRLLPGAARELTLSAAMMAVAGSRHLWGKRVTTSPSALQALQSQLAQEVLLALRAPRRASLPPLQIRPVDPAAYQAYLKGRYQWNKRSLDGFEKAIEAYREAIEVSPAYPLAHAGLADTYAFLSGMKPPGEVFPLAIAEARRALQLDAALPEAHASLGFSQLHFEWDWAASESSCKRAVELNSNYPSGHSYYGRLLTVQRRFEEAIQQVRLGQTLDPLSPALGQSLAQTLYQARRHTQAAAEIEKVIRLDSKFSGGFFMLAVIRLAQGNLAAALDSHSKGLAISPNDSGGIADWGMVNGLAGNAAAARGALERLQKMALQRYISPYLFALPHIGLGEKSHALDWLEKAAEDHSWQLPYIGVEPKMDSLRPEPRFQALARRLKLP